MGSIGIQGNVSTAPSKRTLEGSSSLEEAEADEGKLITHQSYIAI